MVIVGIDPLEVERGLLAGEIGCPDCSGWLGPWGWARRRVLRCSEIDVWRRPRRGRCAGCRRTHVLLGQDSLVRRRDGVEVIGAALVAKAAGDGHRRAAEKVGAPASTVRGWFRRFAAHAEVIRVWFTVLAHVMVWTRCWGRSLRPGPGWATRSKRSRSRPGRRPFGSVRVGRGSSRCGRLGAGCCPTRVAPGRRSADQGSFRCRRVGDA